MLHLVNVGKAVFKGILCEQDRDMFLALASNFDSLRIDRHCTDRNSLGCSFKYLVNEAI
jgi:hypothetical protein